MRFIQELLDSIIDNLSDNLTALRACSLVSSAWRPRRQSHLLADFSLNSSPHCRNQLQFYVEHPHLTGYVRRLTIDSGAIMVDGERSIPLGEVPPITFSHVTMMELAGHWSKMTPAIQDHIRLYLPPLTSLSLGLFVSFATFSALVSFLQECPWLRHLSLHCDVEVREDESVSPWHGKCNLNLKTLEISLGSGIGPDFLADEFLEWMGENSDGQVHVGTLTIYWTYHPKNRKRDLVVTQRLLDALSASLEELKVTYDADYQDTKNISEVKVSLARCKRVHTFSVELIDGVGTDLDLDFSWILQLVSSKSLDKLQITLSFTWIDELEYIPWAQMHDAIIKGSERRGKGLCSFVLDLWRECYSQEDEIPLEVVTKVVESNMPCLKGSIELNYR